MSNETARNEPDGAEFLKELDLALEGQNPEGAHAETARFAAQLAGVLQSQRAAAPAELKARLSPAAPAAKKASTVVSIDRALARRSRMGVLDWVAVAAIVVLGALIWRGLRNEPEAPADSKKLAAEDSKPPVKKEDAAPPAPAPGPGPGPDAFAEAIVEDSPENVAAAKKLERQVSFEFVDTPLGEALQFVGTLTTVPIVLDPKAAAAEFHKRAVTLRVENMPLSTALKWITRLAELNYEMRSGAVFITPWLDQESVDMRVLDVKESPIPANVLAPMLRNLPFGGDPNPAESVEALGSLLRITKPRRVHNQMVGIIARLIERRDANTISLDEDAAPWKAAIRKKLQRKVSLEFVDTPLEEAIAFFRSLTGVTVIVHPAAFNPDTLHLNLRVTDVDAELALQWTLRLTGMEYQLLDEALYIAPAEHLKAPVVFTGYNISALMKKHNLSDPDILNMLTSSVEPDSWNSTTRALESGGGWLFVMQTPEVHAKIQQALLKLSQPAKPRLKAVPGATPPPEKDAKNPTDPAAKAGQDF